MERHRLPLREPAGPPACRRLDYWPTREQECLLRAALLHGRPAFEAWEEWKAHADLDHLDAASYRLIPQLYMNLHRQGGDEPALALCRGIYRHTWYQNQLLFHQIAGLLRSLRDAGIDTMVLKGAALALLYYKDCGLRPMDDVDLLVPERALADAIGLVQAAKFAPVPGGPGPNARSFQDAEGRQVDLHWGVFALNPRRVSDAHFWDGAVPIEIHGVPAVALNPSDQLLHVCVHGAPWNPVPTIRWVADAMTILAVAESAVDWNRLWAQAQTRRLTLPLQGTLGYLRDAFDAPIPDSILQGLRRERTSVGERMAYAANTRSRNGLIGPWAALYDLYQTHCACLPAEASVLRRLAEFPRFLQRAWRADRLWQVPVIAGVKGLRRMGRIDIWYRRQWAPGGRVGRLPRHLVRSGR